MTDLPFPQRKWLRHGIPIRVRDATPVFFVTICCAKRGRNQLATAERWDFLQESIERRNREGLWRCTLFLVMPDHAHGLFAFDEGKGMVSAIANWKRWTARKEGIDWQNGFFDHRLRAPASVMEKRGYILMNPVRAGLVEKSSDWPYVFDVCG